MTADDGKTDTFGEIGQCTVYLVGTAFLPVDVGLLGAVLVGILGVTLVSLVVMVRQAGLVTSETKVSAIFVAIAIGRLLVLQGPTAVPQEPVFCRRVLGRRGGLTSTRGPLNSGVSTDLQARSVRPRTTKWTAGRRRD